MDYDENEEEDEELMNEKGSTPSMTKETNKEKLTPPNLQPKEPGSKQKRRSKNDCAGRDYVCGCGKTYLSYPALYTHIKTKHNGKTPEGTNANQVQSGRGRGRPRKNFLLNEDQIARKKRESNRNDVSLEERNPEFKDLLSRNNLNSNDSVKENEDNYYFIYNSFGLLREGSVNESMMDNNTNTINNNNNISINQTTAYPSPIDLFPIDQTKGTQGYEQIRIQIESLSKTMSDIDNITNKKDITCDMAIALFLIEVSKIVTPHLYSMMIIILKHYRDCMNKLGWNILAQHKYLFDEDYCREYCAVKDPSRLPEIANDFLNQYLHYHLPKYDRYFAVIIISHFNFWLFKNNLTIINLKLKN